MPLSRLGDTHGRVTCHAIGPFVISYGVSPRPPGRLYAIDMSRFINIPIVMRLSGILPIDAVIQVTLLLRRRGGPYLPSPHVMTASKVTIAVLHPGLTGGISQALNGIP